MEHKEAYELIDAYVFGTLSKSERVAVEEHLATGCAECEARMVEAGEVSVKLAEGLKQARPPAELKRSLMAQISKTVPVSQSPDSSQKLPQEQTGGRWPKMLAFGSIAAVIVLALWNVSLNNRVRDLQSQLTNSNSKLNELIADNSVQNEATILLGKPCTKLVDLKGVAPNKQAFAKLFLHPDEDVGVFYAYQMPTAPANRQYQVWIKRDGVIQSVGAFTVREDGSALLEFHGLPKVPTIDSFMVTIEPLEGAAEPTGMTYLRGPNPLSNIH